MEDKNKELVNYFFQIMGDERFLTVLEKYANGEGYG
ncbi:ribonuclease toxin immunity protein CdiI, partial [Lysinibacillus fusiformis]